MIRYGIELVPESESPSTSIHSFDCTLERDPQLHIPISELQNVSCASIDGPPFELGHPPNLKSPQLVTCAWKDT